MTNKFLMLDIKVFNRCKVNRASVRIINVLITNDIIIIDCA